MLCRKDTERSKTVLPMLTRELLACWQEPHIKAVCCGSRVSCVPTANNIVSAHLFSSTSECNCCVHICQKDPERSRCESALKLTSSCFARLVQRETS